MHYKRWFLKYYDNSPVSGTPDTQALCSHIIRWYIWPLNLSFMPLGSIWKETHDLLRPKPQALQPVSPWSQLKTSENTVMSPWLCRATSTACMHIEDANASKDPQSDRCPESSLCHWGTKRTSILLKSILYLIASGILQRLQIDENNRKTPNALKGKLQWKSICFSNRYLQISKLRRFRRQIGMCY